MTIVLAALAVLVMGCAIAGIGMGQAAAEQQPAPTLMPTDYAQRMSDNDVRALAAFVAAASGAGEGETGGEDSGRGRGRGGNPGSGGGEDRRPPRLTRCPTARGASCARGPYRCGTRGPTMW